MGMVRVSNALPNHAWPAGDDPTPSVKHALRSRQRTRSAHGRARSELSPDAAKAPRRVPSRERAGRRIPNTALRNQLAGTGSEISTSSRFCVHFQSSSAELRLRIRNVDLRRAKIPGGQVCPTSHGIEHRLRKRSQTDDNTCCHFRLNATDSRANLRFALVNARSMANSSRAVSSSLLAFAASAWTVIRRVRSSRDVASEESSAEMAGIRRSWHCSSRRSIRDTPPASGTGTLRLPKWIR